MRGLGRSASSGSGIYRLSVSLKAFPIKTSEGDSGSS